MAKKKRGYVELYWTCPNCGGENLGSESTCLACGKPQPDDVEFHQGSHQAVLKDQEKIKRAEAGTDIHCAYCGARNPAGAQRCSQCGSDISEGSLRASAGRVVGAYKEGVGAAIVCPNCGTHNPYENRRCQNCGTPLTHKTEQVGASSTAVASAPGANRKTFLIGAGILLALFAIVYFLFLRTSELTGVVTAVEWQRRVVIESFGVVEREDWRDEMPQEADLLSCSEEPRGLQSEPPASGRYDEICGTPYNVETGGGFAEVVQDCEYQVYDDFCTYTVMDWTPLATVESLGADFSPAWPSPALATDQRLGEQNESYVCIFDAGGETYTYSTSSLDEFRACEIGSTWTLNVNALGALISLER